MSGLSCTRLNQQSCEDEIDDGEDAPSARYMLWGITSKFVQGKKKNLTPSPSHFGGLFKTTVAISAPPGLQQRPS